MVGGLVIREVLEAVFLFQSFDWSCLHPRYLKLFTGRIESFRALSLAIFTVLVNFIGLLALLPLCETGIAPLQPKDLTLMLSSYEIDFLHGLESPARCRHLLRLSLILNAECLNLFDLS